MNRCYIDRNDIDITVNKLLSDAGLDIYFNEVCISCSGLSHILDCRAGKRKVKIRGKYESDLHAVLNRTPDDVLARRIIPCLLTEENKWKKAQYG